MSLGLAYLLTDTRADLGPFASQQKAEGLVCTRIAASFDAYLVTPGLR